MEQVVILFVAVIISALVALIGKDRKIGYGWSFVLCLFLSPIIGLIIILLSKKKDVEFVDANKNQ
jgi:ABC-type multidrug transport system permease subunit